MTKQAKSHQAPRKHIKPENDRANKMNPNKGTDGTNRQYDQRQGNRGKQIQQKMQNEEREQGK